MTSEASKTETSVEAQTAAQAGASGEVAAKKTRAKATKPAKAAQAATRGRKPANAGSAAAKGKKPAVKPDTATSAKKVKGARPAKEKKERTPRADTKQAQLIGMLRRPDGVTVDEAAEAFGWQAHTVRGAIYGALSKKLGLTITSDKVEGRGRVYRIAD